MRRHLVSISSLSCDQLKQYSISDAYILTDSVLAQQCHLSLDLRTAEDVLVQAPIESHLMLPFLKFGDLFSTFQGLIFPHNSIYSFMHRSLARDAVGLSEEDSKVHSVPVMATFNQGLLRLLKVSVM